MLLVGAVIRAITFELWFLGIWITDGPPPRIDALMLLSWSAGSFVATRVDGLRALTAVALYAVASISLTIVRLIVEPVLQCALVPRPGCATNALEWIAATPWVVEGLTGQLWTVAGLALGALVGRVVRRPIPLVPGLAALSVFAFGFIFASYVALIGQYTVCFSPEFVARCIDHEYLFWFATNAVLGIAASVALARLGGGGRDALVVGSLLFLAYLPGPAHQIAMIANDGPAPVLGNLGGLIGVLLFTLLSIRRSSATRNPQAIVVEGRLRSEVEHADDRANV